jgi:peptide-methionine (S)-S-oxide reductase
LAAILAILALACDRISQIPALENSAQAQPAPAHETAVLAGGCFWGVDAVFKHVTGVSEVMSGYSGGAASTARYELVSTGLTGHAESVKVDFDPSKISYVQLLKIFFSVAHDPTQLNRQGPDAGSQYRSVIFYSSDEQKKIAQDYIAQLNKSGAFSQPISTQVVPLKHFYPAEEHHQNFLALHPDNPYIYVNDLPKLAALREKFRDLYKE